MTCSYTLNSSGPEHVAGELCGSPTKRRHIEASPSAIRSTAEISTSPAQNASGESTQTWDDTREGPVTAKGSPRPPSPTPRAPLLVPTHKHGRRGSVHDLETQSGRTASIGQAEEATIYTETRMLQDQTGRLRMRPPLPLDNHVWDRFVLTDLFISLHGRCIYPLHLAAHPHNSREHCWTRGGIPFYRRPKEAPYHGEHHPFPREHHGAILPPRQGDDRCFGGLVFCECRYSLL